MDYKKIFIKNACPTSIGGQAIMDGVMMRGPERIAIAMRLPDDRIYLRTKKIKTPGKTRKIPILRGVMAFIESMTTGIGTMMESADILTEFFPEDEEEEPSRLEEKITNRFGEKALWNIMMTFSLILALVFSIGVFVIFPTVAISWLGRWISSSVLLNLIEGVLRILLFILYVVLIVRMPDIKTLFQYHGSEHKTIHCFENGLELTPENAQTFYTLHPRCGTSFLIFVMIISLLLFSFLGWPNLWLRIGSRILLIPVIAGLSYEVLRIAGRSDNLLVRILSYPGLMMQRLTTAEPTNHQLEVAIVSLKAVLVDADAPLIDGIVDKDAKLIPQEEPEEEKTSGTDEGVPVDAPSDSTEEDSATATPEMTSPSNSTAAKPAPAKGIRYESADATLGNLLHWGKSCLSMVENGANEAVDIMRYVKGYTQTDIILRSQEVLDQDEQREYERRIEMRLHGTPLQYITGVQEFMGLLFRVNPSVLIPRLDTEILVDQAIGILQGKAWENPFILDMCTGSGAIGITMAYEFPDAEVTLTDVSKEAISTAMGNAQLNQVFPRCLFLEGDMFEAIPKGKRFDMIISNPPYIESAVIDTLSTEVKDHEPKLALDGGEDGLKFYRILAENSDKYLADGGFLMMEIGYNQGDAVRKLLEETGAYRSIAVLPDLNHLDRIVIAERKERS